MSDSDNDDGLILIRLPSDDDGYRLPSDSDDDGLNWGDPFVDDELEESYFDVLIVQYNNAIHEISEHINRFIMNIFFISSA